MTTHNHDVQWDIPSLDWDGDEGLSSWLSRNKEPIEASIAERGAVMLRAALAAPDGLADISSALGYRVADLAEESSPRSKVSGDVFTSTDYPASYPIQMHNEYSYASRWPLRIMFGCLQPAATGGDTPLADMRKVLKRLSPALVRGFIDRRIMYRRNYVPGLGVDWRTAFGTSSRDRVDAYCSSFGIRTIWMEDDRLRTEQIGEAVLAHPRTGESLWFNHGFFFNVRSLEPLAIREFMLDEDEGDLSTNTYYGDGQPIEPDVIEELRQVIKDCTHASPWGEGDVMIVDNMLMSHGRAPFSGSRKVVVMMADAVSRRDVLAAASSVP